MESTSRNTRSTSRWRTARTKKDKIQHELATKNGTPSRTRSIGSTVPFLTRHNSDGDTNDALASCAAC